MASNPDITFTDSVNPFPVVSSFNFIQSKLGSGALPVLQGEESNAILFRVYNNFLANSGVADAINVSLTTYDGPGTGSHTAFQPPVSQSWVHILENGFGENSTPIADLYTKYKGVDTPVGGDKNVYYAQKGSDGAFGYSRIRASGGLGVGYIEYRTYARPAEDAVGAYYSFVITAIYEWTT